jgi:predicted esterase
MDVLELAGVPVLVRSPSNKNKPAPLIILWHGFGIPNSEEVLASTLPLENVEAWKAYLGLPLFGKRIPEGGEEELTRRMLDDYLLKLMLPVIEQAVQELPEVVKELQGRFNINPDMGIGLFGFSAGGMAALLALLESNIKINTAVLTGVTKDLDSVVKGYDRVAQNNYSSFKEKYSWVEEKHQKYSWSPESEAAKQRLDCILLAQKIAKKNPPPAILFLHGEQDEIWDVKDIEELYAALLREYEKLNFSKRLLMQTYKHLKHEINPAALDISEEQHQDITLLKETVTNWLSKHLTAYDNE